jgi:hypothetical protein
MPVNPVKFELRRDTLANWTAVGGVLRLSPGEPAVVLPAYPGDTGQYVGQMKIGDGVTVWNNLPWVGVGGGDNAWYIQYIVNPPPAPQGLTIDSANSSQYVNVSWLYPPQINAGAIPSGLLPEINSFSARLEGVTYGGVANQTVVLPTTDSHFVYQVNGTAPIILLQLVPFSGTSGYVPSLPGYRIYDSNFATMTNGAGLIRIWYTNYNVTSGNAPFTSTAGPITFNLAQGPPTAPRNLAVNLAGTSVTFSNSLYANSSNQADTNAAVSTYQYSYLLTSTASRYGGALADSGYTTIPVVNQSTVPYASAVSFNPGSVYDVSLTATNTYALTSPSNFITTNQTNFPTAPTATAFTMTPRYYASATKVADATTTALLLSNYSSGWASSAFFAPIQTLATIGSTGSALSTLVYSITGGALAGSPTFPTITFNGFGVSPASTSAGSTTLLQPTTTVADAYTTPSSQGFYLRGTNSFTIDLTQTANFVNSSVFYAITTTMGSTAISSNFYYDSIAGSPSVTPSIAMGANTLVAVSGLSVYGSTEQFATQLLCANMGDYFCPSVMASFRIIIVDAYTSTTDTGSYINIGLGNVFAGTIVGGALAFGGISGNVKFLQNNSELLESAYAIATASVNGTVYNLLGGTAFDSASTSVQRIVIDQPSITLLATLPVSLPVVGTTNALVVGRLVPSGTSFNATTLVPTYYTSPSDPSIGDIAYNQSTALTTNYDLFLANGKFRTWGTDTYYRDYTAYGNPNYSTIAHTASDYRFITFAWTVNTATGFNFNNIAFTISRAKAGSLTFDPINFTAYIGGTPLIVYYRFEEQGYRIPDGTANFNSDWVNLNQVTTPVSSGNYNILTSTDPTTPVVKGGFQGRVTTTTNSDTSVNYAFTPRITRAGTITSNTYLYCRIVLPMNLNFEFASISANLYST